MRRVVLVLAAATVFVPGSLPAAASRPNILLITVESLRSDRLGCYTGGARKTPVIDGLAARGVRFTRAYAASPSTEASVATILTGVHPARHGLRDDLGGHLSGGVPTLAASLRDAGYRTGAVVGSFHLNRARGLDRGFDTFDDDIKGVKKRILGRSRERRAEEVARGGLVFLDTLPKGKPFFLWLDFYDPHYDFDPPAPFKDEYSKDPYQGEVANVDAQVGSVVQGLRSRGLGDSTHIVLAAAHGEGLGDHGETGHGVYLFETTIRVPLLLVPSRAATVPSRTVDRVVGLIDLAPTILGLAGVRVPAGVEGRSLEPLLSGAAGAGDPGRYVVEAVHPRTAYGWSALVSVIEGDRKIVLGGRLEAFDLKDDPGEKKPIQPSPAWAAVLETRGRDRVGPIEPPGELRRDILKRARLLRLPWEDSPICLEKQQWPDPRDRQDLNEKLFVGRILGSHEFVGDAMTAGEAVLETDRANLSALEMVIFPMLRNHWLDMIPVPLGLMQCNYPYSGVPYHYLAHYFDLQGDRDKAEQALRILERLEPLSYVWEYDLAAIRAQQDRKDDAVEHLTKAAARGALQNETILRDSRFLNLKGDPRFVALVNPPVPQASTSKPGSR